MHDIATRRLALKLLAEGRSLNEVSKCVGVSRAALREWRDRGIEPLRPRPCPREEDRLIPAESYAELFGFYLGDGCISPTGRTYSLRVSCDMRYPRIVEDVARLIETVRGPEPVTTVRAPGCLVVCAYWNHWPCLFPQHGPGRKHERRLVMEDWQREIVATHAADFVRGLFHSDGCRTRNWTTRDVGGERKRYDYGRWQFVNHSTEIRQWCTEALDELGVEWRHSNWKTISVSRREGVHRLDELVGPKT